MIKAIIFDFYGVVCSEIGSPWYKTYPSEEQVQHLKETYDIPSNLGTITEETFFAGIGAAVGRSGEAVRQEWIEAAMINQDVVTLITELKKEYRVALCSNTQPKLFRELLESNDLKKLFDVVVSSSEIGLMKPSPEMFKHVIQELGVAPEEAVFIDDRTENVAGAKAIGITSIRFENEEQLRAKLKEITKS